MKHKRIKGVLILALWLSSLAVIAFSTLSPFVFSFDALSVPAAITLAIGTPTHPVDILANIVLFIPLGFSSYTLGIRRPQHHPCQDLMRIGWMSIVLSLLIEITQLFIPGRFPTFSDIIFNGLGGFLGGFFALQLSVPKNQMPAIKVSKKIGTLAYLSYFISIYIGLYLFTNSIQIHNWQPSYPISIGNDATHQAPWFGKVSNLFIFDTALAPTSISPLLHSQLDPSSDQSLAFYCLPDREMSENNRLPAILDYCHQTSPTQTLNTEATSIGGYLIESGNVDVIQRLKTKSAFTLALTIKPEYNPEFSVIFASAQDIDHANFVVGMQQSQLIFRVRSSLSGLAGIKPEIVLSYFHQNFVEQNLVIVYDGISLRVYKDKIGQSRAVNLLTGVYFFQPLSYLYQEWRLSLLRFDLYKYLFIIFTFLPAVFWVSYCMETGKMTTYWDASQYILGTAILSLMLSQVYASDSAVWLSEFRESLGIIFLCWLSVKLYWMTLKYVRI